jgi:hypothetical protein
MKVITMVQFERDKDEQMLKRIEELCNMAASFFIIDKVGRDEMIYVRCLWSWNPISTDQIETAMVAVFQARLRVGATEPHPFFMTELKRQYIRNLDEVHQTLQGFLETASGARY